VGRKHFYELFHPEDREELKKAALEVFGRKEPFRGFINRNITRTGDTVWLSTSGVPVLDAKGNLTGYRGADANITEGKQAEEERCRLEAQIRDARKLESLGVLAAGIARDFNNLLVGVLGYAGLAERELPAESPVRNSIQKIENAAHRAENLTKQLLAYAGEGRFIVAPLDLSALIQEMAHLLATSTSKNATLKYDLAENLPPIQADSAQVRQLIMNLVTNASDAIGEKPGVITVATGVMEADRAYLADAHPGPDLPEGRCVYVEVSDTGCGMEEKTKANIFDPFFTTKFTGRGLGLAAVLGVARGHRGAIKIDSEPGRGSTFRILFPQYSKQTVAP
jgi:signal transduction histidine kinase